MAVDLRDGLRLARVAEIMLARMEEGEGGIDQNMLVSNLLRVPAVSRLQKVFNVKTALSYLAHLGIDLNYTTTEIIRDVDICDGHRHKTLVSSSNLSLQVTVTMHFYSTPAVCMMLFVLGFTLENYCQV